MLKNVKKALIHENYYTYGGAEKVIESITNLDPDWDHFALTDQLPGDIRKIVLKGKSVNTSFIEKLPFAKNKFRHYLPLFPLAIESFDLSEYDIVVSCSASVAKGVLTGPNQFHMCYMHTPIRYAWDLQFQYLKEAGMEKGPKSFLAKYFLHKIRQWDVASARRPDKIVTNSHYVAKRVRKYYNIEPDVLHPPVDTDRFQIGEKSDDYYFTFSRMVPYKKIDLIVEAFTKMGKRLVVAGSGPDKEKIKALAGSNIEFTGYLSDEELVEVTKNARAFLFAANEDFGIAPVEAQACGVPVIAYGIGGVLESTNGVFEPVDFNKEEHTAIYFKDQTVKSIEKTIGDFESIEDQFDQNVIRTHSQKFNSKHFEKSFLELLTESYTEWKKSN